MMTIMHSWIVIGGNQRFSYSDAQAEDNKINSIATHTLATCIANPSAAPWLWIIKTTWAIPFLEMVENTNIYLCFLKLLQQKKGWLHINIITILCRLHLASVSVSLIKHCRQQPLRNWATPKLPNKWKTPSWDHGVLSQNTLWSPMFSTFSLNYFFNFCHA